MKKHIMFLTLFTLTLFTGVYSFLEKIYIISLISGFTFAFIAYISCIIQNNKIKEKNQLIDNSIMNIDNLINVSEKLFNSFCILFNESYTFLSPVLKSKTISDKYSSICRELNSLKPENQNLSGINNGQTENRIKNFLNLSNRFLSVVENNDINIYKEAGNQIKLYFNNEDLEKIILFYDSYSHIIQELINSTIKNLSITSDPLSQEIFDIKKKINNFLDKLWIWKENLTNEKNGKSFNRLVDRFNNQNTLYQDICSKVGENYNNLEKNFSNITGIIKKISDNSHIIQDISEKIKTLSVNASIVSARAGEAGKGFSVIASEIKKLSETTQRHVKETVDSIGNARFITENALKDFEHSSNEINNKVDEQKADFADYYNILKSYNTDFNNIFDWVTDLTCEIQDQINQFNSVFQFHDISLQELNNLDLITKDFVLKYKSDIEKISDNTSYDEKKNIVSQLLDIMERRITTDMELDIVQKISENNGLKRLGIKRSNLKIEMF